EEREDPQGFGKGHADEQRGGLAGGGRRVAQGARQEVAGNVAHTDGGPAHADGGQADPDVLAQFSDIAFHDDAPCGWKLWMGVMTCASGVSATDAARPSGK